MALVNAGSASGRRRNPAAARLTRPPRQTGTRGRDHARAIAESRDSGRGAKSRSVRPEQGFREPQPVRGRVRSGASEISSERGTTSDSRRMSTTSSRGRDPNPIKGMIASDARRATRAMRIRRAGWRQASIASSTKLKNSVADKARIEQHDADAIDPEPGLSAFRHHGGRHGPVLSPGDETTCERFPATSDTKAGRKLLSRFLHRG